MTEMYLTDWEKIERLVRHEEARELADKQPLLADEWQKLGDKVRERINECDREAKGYGA